MSKKSDKKPMSEDEQNAILDDPDAFKKAYAEYDGPKSNLKVENKNAAK